MKAGSKKFGTLSNDQEGENMTLDKRTPTKVLSSSTLNLRAGRPGAPTGPARTQPNPPAPPKGKARNPLPRGTTRQKDGRAVSEGITIQKYNELAAAYWTNQSANYVAKTCNVTHATAKKYIEVGDLARGLRSLKSRYDATLQKVQRKEDETWASAMQRFRGPLGVLKGAFIRWAKLIMDNAGARLADPNDPNSVSLPGTMDRMVAYLDADPARAINIMHTLMKIDSFTLGGPDQRSEVVDNPYQDWSWEEKMEFLKTGRRPDRLSPILSGKRAFGQE